MSTDPWSDRIAAADDDGARRTLLGEISLWRAGRLTDIVAARQATFAISRLHWLLREKEQAEQEGRQLLSLCQTPPRASGEELNAAKGWLASLGADVPKVVEPKGRGRDRRGSGRRGSGRKGRKGSGTPRGKKPQKSENPRGGGNKGPTLVELAVAAGDGGHWSEAMGLLRGKKGNRVELARTWLHLARALSNPDDKAVRADLEKLSRRLHDRLAGSGLQSGGAPANQDDRPARSDKPARADKQANASQAQAPQQPPEPKKPSPRELAKQRNEALREGLTAEPMPEVDAIVPLLADFKRLWRAIASAERWDLGDERMERLLLAVDKASDDDRQIPGGTSLCVRRAAQGADRFAALLLNEPTASRYGGEGMDQVVALARAAAADGWTVDRVLRGPTRKEVGRHAVLGTVESSLQGLWRILVNRGEKRAELWYIADLPLEGRAGVPMLLLEDHDRVVSLPIEPELLAWYGTLDGPDAIGWTGDEADAVREALSALG